MLLQGITPPGCRVAPLRSELKEFGSCDGLATDVEDFRHLVGRVGCGWEVGWFSFIPNKGGQVVSNFSWGNSNTNQKKGEGGVLGDGIEIWDDVSVLLDVIHVYIFLYLICLFALNTIMFPFVRKEKGRKVTRKVTIFSSQKSNCSLVRQVVTQIL